MITTPEEYFAYLFQIQSQNPPTVAILPSAEKVYEIDLNSREIETPDYLSVERDHKSETVYFKINRFFDYMDLSETVCVIQYITADNRARIYAVPFYDIVTCANEDKMVFPWVIDGGATSVAGEIQYSIRFFKLDPLGSNFVYNLNTQPAKSKVLHGIDISTFEEDQDYVMVVDAYSAIMARIDSLSKEQLYWMELY